ncbi:achaete-scute homolog 3 [Hyla sarda]|uniref:achaete-scute homolog 3 n=1 Tax=Hyla sarda TaxID=327740 RepID=UPI0024C371E1|nr:achaete-scute homolog 3 [Hyla sarda]
MSDDLYSLERVTLVSEAISASLPPFCLDASMMYHVPPEMYQFPRCQDRTLCSYMETPGLDPYYSCLYGLPAPPPCPLYGNGYYGPSYVRKRNERERQRVKCVNEGYTRLRRHLPPEYTEKRISKVQTLRAAIKYIRHLQDALCWENQEDSNNIDTQRRKP